MGAFKKDQSVWDEGSEEEAGGDKKQYEGKWYSVLSTRGGI